MLLFSDDPECNATISPCKLYRYRLLRRVGPGDLILLAICLNPSTADHYTDDSTSTRLIQRARVWGYGRLVICNAYGFRGKKPKCLLSAEDPIGPENDRIMLEEAQRATTTLVAWGAFVNKPVKEREAQIVKLLAGVPLSCLAKTKGGHPEHPLYIPGEAELDVWTPAA